MMRLNIATDYAIRTLVYLAVNTGKLHSVADVSRAHQIPHSTVMKVVSELVRHGFIQSLRGRTGGIRLSRSAEDINIGDVIASIEEKFTLIDCKGCVVATQCRLPCIVNEAIRAFIAVMSRYTLANVLSQEQADNFKAPGFQPVHTLDSP